MDRALCRDGNYTTSKVGDFGCESREGMRFAVSGEVGGIGDGESVSWRRDRACASFWGDSSESREKE